MICPRCRHEGNGPYDERCALCGHALDDGRWAHLPEEARWKLRHKERDAAAGRQRNRAWLRSSRLGQRVGGGLIFAGSNALAGAGSSGLLTWLLVLVPLDFATGAGAILLCQRIGGGRFVPGVCLAAAFVLRTALVSGVSTGSAGSFLHLFCGVLWFLVLGTMIGISIELEESDAGF